MANATNLPRQSFYITTAIAYPNGVPALMTEEQPVLAGRAGGGLVCLSLEALGVATAFFGLAVLLIRYA
jgi:hypothetical protein